MDIIQHAAQGFLIAKGIEALTGGQPVISVEVGSALCGALPDLIGEAERLVKRDRLLWNWYGKAHSMEAICVAIAVAVWGVLIGPTWLAVLALAYMLHLLLDQFTHIDMGAKRNWYPPNEMWKENFWAAVAYCWPNWIGWGATFIAYIPLSF